MPQTDRKTGEIKSDRTDDHREHKEVVKITIQHSQMDPEMLATVKKEVLKAYKDADGKGKETAKEIKKRMDQLYTPTWHVIGGRQFATFVTHETGFYCYLYVGNMGLLLFKSA